MTNPLFPRKKEDYKWGSVYNKSSPFQKNALAAIPLMVQWQWMYEILNQAKQKKQKQNTKKCLQRQMVRKDETILFQNVLALNAFVAWLTDWTERWGCWDYLHSVFKYSAKSDCMNTSAK